MVWITIVVFVALLFFGATATAQKPKANITDNALLDMVQRDHFQFFRENHHPVTGMALDRNTNTSPASIASVGFALTVYPVAVKRGWATRDEAVEYTLKTLRNLWNTPQGPERTGTSGYKGFFYHFLDRDTGLRSTNGGFAQCELSSIDTALLMAGVLFAKEYFDADNDKEKEIRSLAEALFNRVEWDWMSDANGEVYMAWHPETGMGKALWHGYSEGQLVYALGMGSPTHPLKDGAWNAHIMHVKPQTHYGLNYILLPGGPLFTYQYQHCWIDFRKIVDDKARELGFDWFENAKRATLAQHAYAIANPNRWRQYGAIYWGLTACDGPGNFSKVINGTERTFRGYSERGAPNGFDDGTIAPTAAISSMPFTPDLSLKTLRHWIENCPELYTKQGFRDSFNPSLDERTETGWVNVDSIGIDQGPIVLMIENARSEFCWDVMKKSEVLRNGLKRARFTGGWLTR